MRRLILLPLLLLGCSSNGDDTGGPMTAPDAGTAIDAGPQAAVLFFRDVKPIIDARCASCHNESGIAPIDLTVPAVVQAAGPAIQQQVISRTMPPWHASASCGPTYKNDRSLTEEQIDTISEWVDLGMPMDDPSNEGAPLPPLDFGLTRTDLRVMTDAPYTAETQDDYRCFVIEWPESTVKYVSGFNLEPSNPAVVHHANLYIAEPGTSAQGFRTRAASAPGAGYPCFGGAFEPGVSLLGSWAPGSTGIEYPAGTGIQIDPGSVIVMETHFNIGEGRSGPEQSTLALRLEDSVEKRALIAPFWNFNDWSSGGMPIPSGESDVMHSFRVNPDGLIQIIAPWFTAREIEIHGAGLHMHYLGTSGVVKIFRYGGGEECVLEVPRWDFNWQYGYLHDEPIPFEIGLDELYLECHWDNTAGNQPIIDGERRMMRDVNWGTGSADEMCIGYLYVTAK